MDFCNNSSIPRGNSDVCGVHIATIATHRASSAHSHIRLPRCFGQAHAFLGLAVYWAAASTSWSFDEKLILRWNVACRARQAVVIVNALRQRPLTSHLLPLQCALVHFPSRPRGKGVPIH